MLFVLFVFINSTIIFARLDLYEQGEEARRQGDILKARDFYFKHFTRNPGDEHAPLAIFKYALSNVPYETAVMYLNKVLSEYPNFRDKAIVLDRLAMLHYLKENYRECIKTLGKSLNIQDIGFNARMRATYYIGKSYLLLGNTERAKHFFTQIELSGNSEYRALALLETGECLFKEKKFREARTVFEKIITMYPESEAELKAVYRLGIIYAKIRDYKKAKAAFTYIIQSYNTSLEAKYAKKQLDNLHSGYNVEETVPNIRNSESQDVRRNIVRRNINPEREAGDENENALDQGSTRTDPALNNAGKLTVHIGSYSNTVYAKNLLKTLKKKGFNAYIIKKKINGKLYFSLNIGNYNSRDDATREVERLKNLRLNAKIISRT